jgi:hypothetical protein
MGQSEAAAPRPSEKKGANFKPAPKGSSVARNFVVLDNLIQLRSSCDSLHVKQPRRGRLRPRA